MTVLFLGDPHLGKTFENGVPLERRGERETMVFDQFVEEITQVSGALAHVCLGDLFDKFTVPNRVVLDAANAYLTAAELNPKTVYIILRGNHDAARDIDKKSSFDVFDHLVSRAPNIFVVAEKPLAFVFGGIAYGFFPWHPFHNAREMAEMLDGPVDVAVGHWDLDGNSDNLIPLDVLKKKKAKRAVTGHVHLPHMRNADGFEIQAFGSMQPYAHGEGDRYITLTLAELETIEPSILKDRCVRLALFPGDTIPNDVPDCLQFTTIAMDGKEQDIEVQYEAFDTKTLFEECLVDVSERTRKAVWEKLS